MSLNNIELPDFIVAEWYKDTLLSLPSAPAASSAPATRIPVAPAATTPSAAIPPAAATVPMAPATATLPPAPPKEQAPQPPPSPKAPPIAPPQASPPPPAGAPARAAQSPAATAVPAAPAAEPPYKFLGNNRRKITLLVHSPGSAFLPDNQLAFLTKILEACRMTIADVAIVNQATTPVTITALRQQLSPAIVLLFGMEPVAIRLPINFPAFKLQTYDQCTYLSAPALDLLVLPSEESKLLKSKLWGCLKTLFNV